MTEQYQFILKMYWIKNTKRRETYTGSNFTETSVAMWLFPDTYIMYP